MRTVHKTNQILRIRTVAWDYRVSLLLSKMIYGWYHYSIKVEVNMLRHWPPGIGLSNNYVRNIQNVQKGQLT